MTPESALIELLVRVGARDGAAVFVSGEELSQWPVPAVAALKSQKLLVKTRPARSVVCPGCERECVMPVHTLPRAGSAAVSFVVCDKRDDINRVPVSAERLTQWRCDAEAVCGFITKSLGLRRSEQHSTELALWNIGIARGEKRSQILTLRADSELSLVAGDKAVPLAELVSFGDGRYSVDASTARELVDAASTADPRYTPSNARREARKLDTQAMYEEWRKAYRQLKRQHPHMSDVWYSRQIAKMDIATRRNSDTVRKHMKK